MIELNLIYCLHSTSCLEDKQLKICVKCNHTYINQCIFCEQESEFQKSLKKDQLRNLNNLEETTFENFESLSTPLTIDELRSQRVSYLSGIHIICIHLFLFQKEISVILFSVQSISSIQQVLSIFENSLTKVNYVMPYQILNSFCSLHFNFRTISCYWCCQ